MGVGAVGEHLLATAHVLAGALHRVGALDAVCMREMDGLCLPPRPEYGGAEIKRIRAATRRSQKVFARLLRVDKSAVAQWERGAKRPSGPALRLLEVLDPEKADSPVVRFKRGWRGLIGLRPERFREDSGHGRRVFAELETNLESGRTIGGRRFETLLNGVSAAQHDQVLLDHGEWLVVPTVGAIVPGWLLALPRERVLNFREWGAAGGASVKSVLVQVQSALGLSSENVIWFEHGPAKADTEVGCGLDHAHLHILIQPSFSFDEFSDRARSNLAVEWHKTSVDECYSLLAADEKSYFAAGSGDRAICVSAVERAGSQFFRRVVASLAGKLAEWNYRHFAHAQNIAETTATFMRLARAASRER